MIRKFRPLSVTYRLFSSEIKVVSRKKKSIEPLKSDFNDRSKEILNRMEKIFKDMLNENKDFILNRLSEKELRLKFGSVKEKGVGEYAFVADSDDEVLRVNAPFSGSFEYYFDAATDNWLSVADRHDMRGLITRDLLQHCIGCPNFS